MMRCAIIILYLSCNKEIVSEDFKDLLILEKTDCIYKIITY